MPFPNIGGIHGKKLLQKGLKGLPGGYTNQPPLKPLYQAILKTLKHIETQSVI